MRDGVTVEGHALRKRPRCLRRIGQSHLPRSVAARETLYGLLWFPVSGNPNVMALVDGDLRYEIMTCLHAPRGMSYQVRLSRRNAVKSSVIQIVYYCDLAQAMEHCRRDHLNRCGEVIYA